MNIYVDLDNTLCLTSGSDYENSRPIESRIVKVNKLKEEGNQIIIWTARGTNSGIDWSELTKNQLQKWNIKYVLLVGDHEKIPVRYIHVSMEDVNNSMSSLASISDLYYSDIYFDDKSFSSWDTNNNNIFGNNFYCFFQ